MRSRIFTYKPDELPEGWEEWMGHGLLDTKTLEVYFHPSFTTEAPTLTVNGESFASFKQVTDSPAMPRAAELAKLVRERIRPIYLQAARPLPESGDLGVPQ